MTIPDNGISKQKEQRIEEKIAQFREGKEMEAVQEIIDFDKTPADLKADMDRFVIGQEQGKKNYVYGYCFSLPEAGPGT